MLFLLDYLPLEANKPSDYIRRKALGRTVRLGDLYDVRCDTICGSMLKSAIPDNILSDTKNPSIKFVYIKTERQDEKFEKCEVEAELAASVLCGYVKLSGHGQYFLDNTVNSREVSVSLIYSVSTMTEKFLIPQVLPFISTDSLNNHKQATHFVADIDWGANAALTLKYANDENYEKTEVQSCLEASLRISVEGRCAVDVVDSSSSLNLKCRIALYADISGIDDDLPTTVGEAVCRIKKIPKLIETENGGRGMALSFVLVPISYLKCDGIVAFDRLIRNLESDSLLSISHIFSDIHEAKIKLNDITQLFERSNFCIPDEKRNALKMEKAKVDRKESSMRQQIAQTLKQVRSSEADMFELEVLCQSFTDERILARVDTFIEGLTDVIERTSFIADAIKENAVYIGKNSSFDEERRKFQTQIEYYAMFYSSSQKDEKGSGTKELFLSLLREARVPCFLADLDARPDLAVLEGVPNESIICRYWNGAYFDLDVYQTFLNDRNRNLMKSECNLQQYDSKPKKTVTIQLICPGSIGGGRCEKTKINWLCAQCETFIEYGFDRMFYCNCGKMQCENFVYRCSDLKHGLDYVKYNSEILNSSLEAIENERHELTILLLGATGVGKSTFINALVNYLLYETMDEAAGNMLCLIPTSFLIYDEDIKDMKEVRFGDLDSNENPNTTQSSTQSCRCYNFEAGGKSVKIIDTPGIADSRGVARDNFNLKHLLKFISNYKELNAICVLLKPNDARVGIVFEYCLLELFTHLNKSASKNIVFLFTNSRGTFYKPGDTAKALCAVLHNIRSKPPHVEIKFEPENYFCLDNESFRYLVAASAPNNIIFGDDDKRDFEKSWNRSVKECHRLLGYIKGLPPHLVQDTISVNDVRTKIINITKPIALITEKIAEEMHLCETHKRKIRDFTGDIRELEKELYTPALDIISTPLKHPRTVCSDPKCCEQKVIGNVAKTHYKTICHKRCYLQNSDENIVGNKGLLDCQAFNKYEYTGDYYWGDPTTLFPDFKGELNEKGQVYTGTAKRIQSETCLQCTHSYLVHMTINYETSTNSIQIRDENKYRRITSAEEAVHQKQMKIEEIKNKINELEQEMQFINKCSAHFATFLMNHTITPFNDALEDYINCAIKNAEKKGDLKSVEDYRKRLDDYKREKKAIDDASAAGGTDLSTDQINTKIKELFKLKHYGKVIEEQLTLEEQGQLQSHSVSNVKNVQLKSAKPGKSGYLQKFKFWN